MKRVHLSNWYEELTLMGGWKYLHEIQDIQGTAVKGNPVGRSYVQLFGHLESPSENERGGQWRVHHL
ncbi:hypothetical protein JOB18_043065 [Solea senegalensis]|uniref:Uncharacterized protein n=1 Tax=Solea senegalensis TaxID=28829 RepID=A0AAV6REA7_SOLSE|nr:hypothetical protein JOB18_043065 [Solea senegalensis]